MMLKTQNMKTTAPVVFCVVLCTASITINTNAASSDGLLKPLSCVQKVGRLNPKAQRVELSLRGAVKGWGRWGEHLGYA